MAFGRKEHVGEGKGARRNSHLLPDEGSPVSVEPMRDLKEAGVQYCHLNESEPLIRRTDGGRGAVNHQSSVFFP